MKSQFIYTLNFSQITLKNLPQVTNNTREDGREFLMEAASIPVHTHTQPFPFNQANEALMALKNDSIRGAGVLLIN